ncbi:MAG TPA: alpha/beta fold hydrolase [Pseudonocardiaceae bacterium]|jgi:3-oxoadipate enol-lactonase|nr:alpha/beta fold hydrolase [Pseudonocardiaceae bacterium]
MDRQERARHEYAGLLGGSADEVLAGIRQRSPRMYETLTELGFGGVMTHAELGRAERELATVAIIAALGGAEPQLASHVRGALHQGWSASELLALCEHVTLYAGFPRGLNALTVVDEVLATRPPKLRRIALADHETEVAEAGDTGPAVLLVHSMGADWRVWEQLIGRLAVGRRVFGYDLRGHGHAAGASPFTMADTGRDLLGVLDALGLDRAHVVGLAFGGAIAQTAAVAAPDRFESLALLATTDTPLPEIFETRAKIAETDGMSALVAPMLTRWFSADALAENGWGVRYARERLRRFVPADWAAGWRAFTSLNVRDRLRGFTAPTLVLAGEADVSATPEMMSALARRIPGAEYRQLPGAPHMMTLETSELVADALDKFLPPE